MLHFVYETSEADSQVILVCHRVLYVCVIAHCAVSRYQQGCKETSSGGTPPTNNGMHEYFVCLSNQIIVLPLNSSPASATYMRQWIGSALVQIMAFSHYLNQCWVIVNWIFRNKLQWNFNENINIFTHKNASEIFICEMTVFLSRGRWVKLI